MVTNLPAQALSGRSKEPQPAQHMPKVLTNLLLQLRNPKIVQMACTLLESVQIHAQSALRTINVTVQLLPHVEVVILVHQAPLLQMQVEAV